MASVANRLTFSMAMDKDGVLGHRGVAVSDNPLLVELRRALVGQLLGDLVKGLRGAARLGERHRHDFGGEILEQVNPAGLARGRGIPGFQRLICKLCVLGPSRSGVIAAEIPGKKNSEKTGRNGEGSLNLLYENQRCRAIDSPILMSYPIGSFEKEGRGEGGQDARPTCLKTPAFHRSVGRASCPAGRQYSGHEMQSRFRAIPVARRLKPPCHTAVLKSSFVESPNGI